MTDRYEKAIVHMTADEYWGRVVDSGWLDDVPHHLHQELEQSVREAFSRKPIYAFYALTTTVFDSECIWGLDPDFSYKSQLSNLAETTYDVFRPSEIRHEIVGDYIRVSFDLNGKMYSYDAPGDTDYFDNGVFGVINQAITESGESRRIIELPVTDQIYSLVVVSEQTYRRAEQLMVIPPEEYFLYRESKSPTEVDRYLDEYYKQLG